MSPLYFSVYTNDYRSQADNCTILKYADDKVFIGKIVGNDHNSYINQVNDFVEWCTTNHLILNVKKTKEMVIDFRTKNRQVPDQLVINNEPIERVTEYKYLGMIIDDQLKGNVNTDKVFKKSNQRLYLLRKLYNIHVSPSILNLFYKSTIESILSFSITTWYGKLTKKDKHKLGKIVRKTKRLGIRTTPLDKLYQECAMKQVDKNRKDPGHPLHNHYILLRSGRRLNVRPQRTNRYKMSFVPKSISLYNHLRGT